VGLATSNWGRDRRGGSLAWVKLHYIRS
jgi:hypothetical protein